MGRRCNNITENIGRKTASQAVRVEPAHRELARRRQDPIVRARRPIAAEWPAMARGNPCRGRHRCRADRRARKMQRPQNPHDDLARFFSHPTWSRRSSKVACRTGLELLVSAMPPPSGRVSTGSSRFPILSLSSASSEKATRRLRIGSSGRVRGRFSVVGPLAHLLKEPVLHRRGRLSGRGAPREP